MEDKKQRNFPLEKQPASTYDDDDIPPVDLPHDVFPESTPVRAFPEEMPTPVYPQEMPMDVIPDEVPRKDGPGGENGKNC